MKITPSMCWLIVAISSMTCKKLTGPYLGQVPPGMEAKLFAPGMVSEKDRYEYGSYFSQDSKEFYYAVIVNEKPQIWVSQLVDNEWTDPEVVLASDKYEYNDPFLSPDGKRLFFISDQALDGQGDKKDFDIWYVERKGKGWSKPINSGRAINTDMNEYYMSFTADGTMYFSSNSDSPTTKDYNIRFAKFSGGQFQPSQILGDSVNSEYYEADVFVSPDEKYLIYCGESPDGLGEGDLFISFKDGKGQWRKSINMGNAINTEKYEFCPFVSSDGKYLFFSRDGDIYWISAQVINALK
jgi:Tol biopolymer transport system component